MAHELYADPTYRADAYPTASLSPREALNLSIQVRNRITARHGDATLPDNFSASVQLAKKHIST